MPLPPNPAPGTAQDWLARAKGKLALARVPLPSGAFLEDLCFYAQQAGELAIKAVYQQHNWAFPHVHDLGRLIVGLQDNGLTIPPDVQRSDQLSVYAAQARYPGTFAAVTQLKYEEAVQVAEAVVAWADGIIAGPSSP